MLDKSRPYAVFEPVSDNETRDTSTEVTFLAEPVSRQYSTLSHYCSIQTLNNILSLMTLRCTRLNNVELNDQFEYKRKNIEEFASSIFIFCFTHCKYEIVPFWMNYGGKDHTMKVLLKFKNFSDDLLNVINTDYCCLSNGKKLFYKSEELHKTVKTNGIIGNMHGLQKTNLDFDLRAFIEKVQLFDINYLPINDEVFTTDYSSDANIVLGSNNTTWSMPTYNPSVLGKHKTEHWSYEQETRIKLQLSPYEQDYFNYIDMRMNEKLFSGLEIIMNPWATHGMKGQIENIIEKSRIIEGIKSTIKISSSELAGQVHVT